MLLASLGMLGPFAVDTYLPAFEGAVRASLQATPLQMQQTLSAYLFAFAFMNLFHGALADSFGRRPGMRCSAGWPLFTTLSSIGCALADGIGMLVAMRARSREWPPARESSCRVRSFGTCTAGPGPAGDVAGLRCRFGIAPAIAPVLGALLLETMGWRAIFGLLAAIGLLLLAVNHRWLPSRCPGAAPALRGGQPDARLSRTGREPALPGTGTGKRHPLRRHVPVRACLARIPGRAPRLRSVEVLLAVPVHDRRHHDRGADQRTDGGPGGREPARSGSGFGIMLAASLVDPTLNLSTTPAAVVALPPLALFSLGWAINAPAITLLALEVVPQRRGMASSLQAVIASAFNGLVAGAVAAGGDALDARTEPRLHRRHARGRSARVVDGGSGRPEGVAFRRVATGRAPTLERGAKQATDHFSSTP
jgi:DHA1 family bicyclomycin/chloramphenicol resistance-like MFS transporter